LIKLKKYFIIKVMTNNFDDDYIAELIEYNLKFNIPARETIENLIKEEIKVSNIIIEEYILPITNSD